MSGDFGRYTMGKIDHYFSETIREEQRPLSRKEEIEFFWEKVTAQGPSAQGAHTELNRLSELQENRRLSELKSLERDETYQEASEQVSERLYAEAESTLLALLPPEMKDEYQRLQPLNRFWEKGVAKFPLLKAQCWVFNRTLELGWQQSLHEEIERNALRYSHGRHDHEVERIGKKYQHIAFSELIGYLADYHWYLDWEGEPSVLVHLEDFERADIDATYLSGSFSKPAETYMPETIRVPEMAFVPDSPENNMEWTKTLDDIPDPVTVFHPTGCGWTRMVFAAQL